MNTEVSTRQDTSGGIQTAGGGQLYAWNLNVETFGTSSAAISSGRGGGRMAVDGGAYITGGQIRRRYPAGRILRSVKLR